jgi:hypothetical protein
MAKATWRVVVPEKFTAQLEAIGPEGYDWADTMVAIRYFLGRDPKGTGAGSGQDHAVRIYLQTRPMGLPSIRVFFAIEEEEERTVTLLFAKEAQPDA